MPSSRAEVAVAEVDGKIYVVGGLGGERELEMSIRPRRSAGGRFREVHRAATVGVNGKLYVVGGYAHDWAPTNAMYEYDPAADGSRLHARCRRAAVR